MIMKKLLYITVILFQVSAAVSQRNIDDMFFSQGTNYYNAGYSPTHKDSVEMINAYDTRTMLKIATNNTGNKVIPSLTYQAFSKLDRFVFTYNFNHQSYSYTSNNEVGLGVIYTLPFSNIHKLSFGLRGDFSFYNLKKFNGIDYIQLPKEKRVKLLADIDFGVHYFIKKFEVGVSGKHLLASKYRPDDVLLQNQRGLYMHMSYNFSIGRYIELKPAVFITPVNYLNTFLALELGVIKKVYAQYAFRFNELRHQYNIEYRGNIRQNQFFVGLAFNHSVIYSDFNAGIRLGYIVRD